MECCRNSEANASRFVPLTEASVAVPLSGVAEDLVAVSEIKPASAPPMKFTLGGVLAAAGLAGAVLWAAMHSGETPKPRERR
jgi:hypothetical protein